MAHSTESLFIHVVQAGSLKKAAEQLDMEPSSVSRRFAALEDHLSVKLLHRSTRQTRPTELGQRYYEGISKLLDEKAALEERITRQLGVLGGTFRVSAPVDFGAEFVVPVLRSIQVAAPDLKLDIWLGTRFVDLLEQDVDVAVRIGELTDSSLIAVNLGVVSRVLVASPDYLQRRSVPETPAELEDHEFVFYTPNQTRSDIEFADGSRFPHTKMNGRITVNSVRAIHRLVADGAGIHLGPLWVFKDALKSGEIVQVLPSYELKGFPVHAVYPARAYLPRKTSVFVESLRNHLAGRI